MVNDENININVELNKVLFIYLLIHIFAKKVSYYYYLLHLHYILHLYYIFITFTLYITFILYIYYNKENNRDESKQKQKIKAKKQRYREKRRQREVSSDRSNILSPIDPNTLLALKSYIKLVDEQIDQTNDNDIHIDNKIEDEIVVNNQSVTVEEEKETIIITVEEEKTPSIVKIEEIEENNIIAVNNNEENNNNIINENVETDDLKITSQLNNSLSNGLLLTSINNRVNRYGFHEYEIIISDKSFIQPINGTIKIYRRYNDFYVLNALLHASGFDNLPLLPRKQFFKFIHDENFLNERQQQLDNYLKNIINQYTFQSAGFKNLIRTFLSSRLTTTTIEEI